MSDEEGLLRACNANKGIYVFGDRMHIAGTESLNHVKDEVLRTPFYGSSRTIQRYQGARKALRQHPEVTEVTGHSLADSVALQLQQDFKHIQNTRVHDSPVFDVPPQIGPAERDNNRFRNYGDPVSAFEFKASSACEFTELNPFVNHSYTQLGKELITTKRYQ